MVRIYNPATTVVSVPLSVRIDHVVVATNHVFELYYDTYDVFMNSQAPAPAGDSTVNCNQHSDFAANNYQVGDRQWMRFYAYNKGYSGSFYYVIKLPVDFIPYNIETSPLDYCTGSWHHECMTFPDASYIVLYSHVNTGHARIDVRYPLAISQSNYNIKALVWQGGRYRGIQWITMNSGCQN